MPRAPGGARYAGSGSFENAADLEDMIQDLFGGRGGGRTMRMRGGDVGYRLEVGLGRGGPRRQDPDHAWPTAPSVEVTIPRGVEAGQVLRLKGKGSPGIGGGPPGDALIEIQVRPHPVFERKGDDLHMALPITPGRGAARRQGHRADAAWLGGHDDSPALDHRRACCGSRARACRVPGGAAAGDQYVRLEVALPPAADEVAGGAVADWESQHPYDPRASLMREAGA